MPWEFISKASNGVIEAKWPILDQQCTRRERELQMRFSLFETFYPRHVQRPITLAVCEICPILSIMFTLLESLIHLSSGVINSIFFNI